MKSIRGFASDNNAGVHPDVFKEMMAVNEGHSIGYGGDLYTETASGLFRDHLGKDCEIFFAFNGTGANVLGLSSVTRPWNSIITASTAHIEGDECGAPEKFTGCKVLTVDTTDGKIKPDLLDKHMHGIDFEHHSQPKVISITQSTEMGTVYKPAEIKALADFAHNNNMLLHMDGARIGNAAVSLGLPFKNFTTDAGVDILSFGGTKNGMMYGEAVCFLRPGLSKDFRYIRKQSMQLASKMRYISAQYIAYFKDDLWKRCASHANKMAALLYDKVKDISGVRVTQPVESNGVFVIIPGKVAEKLCESYFFYPWNEKESEYRWMTSWDTMEDDIVKFVELLEELLGN
jgi:threonine aldolase